jgi:hypothetical protein
MTYTPAVGTPATDSALGENVEIWNKATGGGSAITIGKIVCRVSSTGDAAEGGTSSFGQAGIVANIAPNVKTMPDGTTVGSINTDSSNQVAVFCGQGAKAYVTASGSIPAGSLVTYGATGTAAAYTATATSAISTTLKLPIGVYEGHYGESEQSAGTPCTDATNGQVIRIRLGVYA